VKRREEEERRKGKKVSDFSTAESPVDSMKPTTTKH